MDGDSKQQKHIHTPELLDNLRVQIDETICCQVTVQTPKTTRLVLTPHNSVYLLLESRELGIGECALLEGVVCPLLCGCDGLV